MAIVQCKNNHYYDDTKNSECPYCAKLNENLDAEDSMREQLTSYMDNFVTDDAQMTEAYGDFVGEFEKTLGFFDEEAGNALTVGWLICVDGPQKGKSYVINSGRNFVGRSLDMDIILSDDLRISKENHFSIVYDPKSIEFYFVAGNGQTYINKKPQMEEYRLSEGDELEVGDCRYMFVPFCKEGRVWE